MNENVEIRHLEWSGQCEEWGKITQPPTTFVESSKTYGIGHCSNGMPFRFAVSRRFCSIAVLSLLYVIHFSYPITNCFRNGVCSLRFWSNAKWSYDPTDVAPSIVRTYFKTVYVAKLHSMAVNAVDIWFIYRSRWFT